MRIILSLLLFSTLFSCLSSNEKEAVTFNKMIELVSNPIALEKELIVNMCDIEVFHDYLLVYDIYITDHLMHIYNKNTFQHITSFGSRGNGPGEIAQPGFFTLDRSNKHIWINDAGKNRMLLYELDSVLAQANYLPKVQIEPPLGKLNMVMHFVKSSKNTFLTQTFNDERNLFARFSTGGEFIEFTGHNDINDDPILMPDFFSQYFFTFCKTPGARPVCLHLYVL